MFFVRTFTRLQNMHLNLTKHGRFCKQNNELPTKSHDELKDNSDSCNTRRVNGRDIERGSRHVSLVGSGNTRIFEG